MRISRVSRVAVAAVLLALSACAPESGVVTGRAGPFPGDCAAFNKQGQCTVRGAPKWQVCVRGEKESGCDYVDVSTYSRCKEGRQWPSCKEGA